MKRTVRLPQSDRFNINRSSAFRVLLGLGLAAVLAGCAAPVPAATSAPAQAPGPTPTAPPAVPVTHLAPATALPPTSAIPPAAPPPTQPPAITLLFTGDINPGRCVAKTMQDNNDFNWPYEPLAPDLQAADILVGSLDGSITDRAAPDVCPQTMSLNGPAGAAGGLKFAGFDVITVATNHVKNCGRAGCWNHALLDTIDNLSAAGILAVGGGSSLTEARRPAVVEKGGVRFAFIGASSVGADMWASATEPGTNPLTKAEMLADIQAARQIADVVIVLPQWGGEYTHTPNWYQFDLAGQMMDAGATLVIGNQAHWVQAVETFPHGVVAYALGNFVFDQDWSLPTQQGVLFEATFRGAQLESWRLRPIHIGAGFQPRWADSAESSQILADIDAAGRQPPVSTRHK